MHFSSINELVHVSIATLINASRPVARFEGLGTKKILGGKDFCFYYMFKINCIKYFWAQQNLGALRPNDPQGYGLECK